MLDAKLALERSSVDDAGRPEIDKGENEENNNEEKTAHEPRYEEALRGLLKNQLMTWSIW